MPKYIVSVKKGLEEADYEAAAKHIRENGGNITYTFDRTSVAPGFEVDFPENSVGTLESGPHVVGVESDGQVKTQ